MIYGLSVLTFIGCKQLDSDLNVKIINTNLCVFTNESKNYGKDNYLVHMGKFDSSKEYKSEYDRSYESINLPTDEKNCALIPLNKIERNVVYLVNLSTLNKVFSSQICVIDKDRDLIILKVDAGKEICSSP